MTHSFLSASTISTNSSRPTSTAQLQLGGATSGHGRTTDMTHLKPEDLERRVVAVHVAATCERYSYRSVPRRRIFWHIYLKLAPDSDLSPKPGMKTSCDAVEVFKLVPEQHYFFTSSAGALPVRDKLVFASRAYPNFDDAGTNNVSDLELRFLCRLVVPASESGGQDRDGKKVVTVREVVECFRAARNEEPNVVPSFKLAPFGNGNDDNENAGIDDDEEDPYTSTAVGGMQWCVDAVRALQVADLLPPVSRDKLLTEFEGSKYRWEFVQGYTVIV